MSKSVASESKGYHETPTTRRKRGGEDEGDENEEGIIEGAEGVRSGELLVNGGRATSLEEARTRKTRLELVNRVIFLLNITKVGDHACWCARNLVVVEIPEGIKSIGDGAFTGCRSLTTVSFPTTNRLVELPPLNAPV